MAFVGGGKVVFVASGRVVQGILLAANQGGDRWAVAVPPTAIGDIMPRRVLRAGDTEFAVSDLLAGVLVPVAEAALPRLLEQTGTDSLGFALEDVNVAHALSAQQAALDGGVVSGLGDSPTTAISNMGSYVFAGGPPGPSQTAPRRFSFSCGVH